MKSFLSGVVFTLVALLALFFVPQTPFESLTARTFATHSTTEQEVAVLITGCSSGIGRHAAFYLAEKGYHVFATVRKEADAQDLLKQEATNGRVIPVICDVTNQEQLSEARETVQLWLKEADTGKDRKPRTFAGIVNNAGAPGEIVMFQNMATDVLQGILDVNLFGPFLVYQTFLPLIRKFKGRVVNVGSLAGIAARPFRGAYTVSKFALEGFSDTVRQELLLEDISVSMINPGYISTGISRKSIDPSRVKYGETMERADLTDIQKQLLATYETKHLDVFETAPTPEATSATILHALSDLKPRTRYFPGNMGVGSLPAWVVPKIKQILPDRFMDTMVVKITASKND